MAPGCAVSGDVCCGVTIAVSGAGDGGRCFSPIAAGVNFAAGIREQGSHFFFICFVQDERRASFWRSLRIFPDDLDSQDQSVRVRADQQIALRIEGQGSRVPFISLIEKLALAVRRDRKNLTIVSGSGEEDALRVYRESPDIFRFRVKEYRFLSFGSDFVNFAVRRSADVEIIVRIEGDRLRREFGDSNTVVGLAGSSKRSTLASEPPAP